MKRIASMLIAIAVISTAAMAGDNAKSGQWGVQAAMGVANSPSSSYSLGNSIPSTSTLGVKIMASDNVAVRLEAGISSFSPAGGGGSSTGYAFGGGFEYHMTNAGGVSPYVGLQAGYGSGSLPAAPVGFVAPPTPALIKVVGVVGGEYFFASNFSWGGEIGVSYTSLTNQPVDPFALVPTYGTQSSFGSGIATMILTWYLN